jgi:hypothetical protein
MGIVMGDWSSLGTRRNRLINDRGTADLNHSSLPGPPPTGIGLLVGGPIGLAYGLGTEGLRMDKVSEGWILRIGAYGIDLIGVNV